MLKNTSKRTFFTSCIVESLDKFLVSEEIEAKFSYYLIPLNFRAPLIFAHLACAKIRGGNFAQDRCAKFIGSRYYVSKYRQKSKLLSKKGCVKIKGTKKSAGARKSKARKLEARK